MIINNKNFIAIFTVCCLFSLDVLAHNSGLALIRLGRESLGEPRGVPGVITSPIKTTDGYFDRTLDEILETRGIHRGNIPKQVIDQLREATEDPLKLIDGSLTDVTRFFSPRFPGDPNFDEHIDLYRAFLQKQLDPGNTKQMERLADLVDKLWTRLMPDSDDLNTPRYSVLYALTKHSGLNPDEFDIWYANLHTALYKREEFFKRVAEDSFKKGFDEDGFYRYWKDPSFRSFIVDSHFMTKDHLTDHPYLLITWADELRQQPQGQEQLSALIRSSFDEAEKIYSDNGIKKITLIGDEFWNTVPEAIRENNDLSREVQLILRETNFEIEIVAITL